MLIIELKRREYQDMLIYYQFEQWEMANLPNERTLAGVSSMPILGTSVPSIGSVP